MYRAGRFSRFAKWTARQTGHPSIFGLAVLAIIAWIATGPLFGFSDTWQLVVNTGTTIVTFLMVFLIQNTQNRDSEAMQLKLDEIIRSMEGAHNALLDMEELKENCGGTAIRLPARPPATSARRTLAGSRIPRPRAEPCRSRWGGR